MFSWQRGWDDFKKSCRRREETLKADCGVAELRRFRREVI